jgi:hypothetical protein
MSSRRANPVGSIPEPKYGTKITRKKLILGKMDYILTIHETDSSITYFIGGKNIYCADIQIAKNMDGTFSDKASLSKIRKDDACYVGGVYEEGVTTAEIFKFALQLLYDMYPNVKSLRFNDTSYIHCDNGFPMTLATLKLLTNGKTWYQNTFGAKFISPDDEKFLEKELVRMNKIKQETSFNTFSNKFPIKSINLPIEEIEIMYNTSSTWQDFLKGIENKIGKHAFCDVLSERYELFVNDFLSVPKMEYYQFVVAIQNIGQNYKIQNMAGGSRKNKTRRFRWVNP